MPRDVLVAGVTYRTATYRDVARAPGTFPLVVYSHGSSSTRVDDFHLLTHLASHGFVVVSAEHPGNDYLSPCGTPPSWRTARSTCASSSTSSSPSTPGGQLPRRGDRSSPHRRQRLLNQKMGDHHPGYRPFRPRHLHRSTHEGDVPARRGATLLGYRRASHLRDDHESHALDRRRQRLRRRAGARPARHVRRPPVGSNRDWVRRPARGRAPHLRQLVRGARRDLPGRAGVQPGLGSPIVTRSTSSNISRSTSSTRR